MFQPQRRRVAMPFEDLIGRTKELARNATDAAGKLVDEFNKALPTMRALGFTIKDVRVGTGLVPEIGAKLIASTDTIDVMKIKELIEKHPENRTLIGALKALGLAFNIRQQIGDFPFKGVEIDMTLGLPPRIGVAAFVSSAPAPTPVRS
jgi:hypothetical protein